MNDKLDDSGGLARKATNFSGPTQDGLRHRKMVPKILPETTKDRMNERKRLSSTSETKERRAGGNSEDLQGDADFENPEVCIEDPLSVSRDSETCESSFIRNDLITLCYKESRSPADSLSPVGDISISSDEDDAKLIGSFNSKHLYEPVLTDDFDEPNVESMILADGEFRKINEGNREVDIKISTEENSLNIALQVFFPFLIAGLGTVAAGLLLDVVQVICWIEKFSCILIKNFTVKFSIISNLYHIIVQMCVLVVL